MKRHYIITVQDNTKNLMTHSGTFIGDDSDEVAYAAIFKGVCSAEKLDPKTTAVLFYSLGSAQLCS